MGVSFRKAFFERDPDAYPGRDSVRYAERMACDAIIMYASASRSADYRRAARAGLRVYLYRAPSAWEPSAWEATLALCERLVRENGLHGVFANPESGWLDGDVSGDAQRFAERFGALSESMTAVMVSYPSFRYRDVFKRNRIAGSVELYGIRNPGTPAELNRRADGWRDFPGGFVASLAAWGRSASALRVYLQGMRNTAHSVAFWHAVPAWRYTDKRFDLLRRFMPGGSIGIGGAIAAIAITLALTLRGLS